ncbi:MAG: magnesium transporter [Actinomycetota bacterium]|nr:magnesium transporter [Actinomycetota bacterium]
MAAGEQLLGVAAEHATAQVPTASPGQSVGDVRDAMVGASFESAVDVAVLAGNRLVGVVPIEALLAAQPEVGIEAVMDSDPPAVAPGADQEVAAWRMCRKGEASIAVVDAEGCFVGLIPADRMLEVLLAEHDEDLARLGGYLAGTRRAHSAAEESVSRRLYHRLPWLLLGLIGAMGSALLVGAFEEELDKKVLLAFFVPAVVYMADAVGTQTEAVLIRGLSVGITVRQVAFRELVTGVITGVLLGAAFVPFVLLGWGDSGVAAAVALALFASCSIATVVAMALPWLFQRLGADPAFGSGPLATVIQDLLSIAVYLAIAIPLAT